MGHGDRADATESDWRPIEGVSAAPHAAGLPAFRPAHKAIRQRRMSGARAALLEHTQTRRTAGLRDALLCKCDGCFP